MILLIKGMVCNRCIYVLEQEFSDLGFEITEIKLGVITIKDTNEFESRLGAIRSMLEKHGFDLLFSHAEKTVESIKELVQTGISMQVDSGMPTKFSVLISDKLHKNYDTLSALFSSTEGYTLEKFIILKKIEKVKELLVYTDMSLTEIARVLGYSSQGYLSGQLKKHTGFTSSYYKQIKADKELVRKK